VQNNTQKRGNSQRHLSCFACISLVILPQTDPKMTRRTKHGNLKTSSKLAGPKHHLTRELDSVLPIELCFCPNSVFFSLLRFRGYFLLLFPPFFISQRRGVVPIDPIFVKSLWSWDEKGIFWVRWSSRARKNAVPACWQPQHHQV
jgi:hypothetical protein